MTTITDLLTPSGGANPRDREILLAHVLGKSREWVIAHPEADLPPMVAARYHRLLRRLIGTRPTPTGISNLKFQIRGEPLPYLLGEQWFYGRPFTVNRHVLIPRPETELLIELVLTHARNLTTHDSRLTTIDVGTGSGCIAVTLAAELPRARIIATDVSATALRVARTNARRHGVADRIVFQRGDLLEPIVSNLPTPSNSSSQREGEKRKRIHAAVSPCFHGRENMVTIPLLLVANLPYLTTAEWRALPRAIRAYEPRQALDGGPDGLGHFRQLFMQLTQMQLQARSSKLQTFLEIDPRRKRALTALIRKTLPEWRASWHRDLAHRWRVLGLSSLS